MYLLVLLEFQLLVTPVFIYAAGVRNISCVSRYLSYVSSNLTSAYRYLGHYTRGSHFVVLPLCKYAIHLLMLKKYIIFCQIVGSHQKYLLFYYFKYKDYTLNYKIILFWAESFMSGLPILQLSRGFV